MLSSVIGVVMGSTIIFCMLEFVCEIRLTMKMSLWVVPSCGRDFVVSTRVGHECLPRCSISLMAVMISSICGNIWSSASYMRWLLRTIHG